MSEAGSDSAFDPEEEEEGPATQSDHLLAAKYRRAQASTVADDAANSVQHDQMRSSCSSGDSQDDSPEPDAMGHDDAAAHAVLASDLALVNVFLNHPDIESEVSERKLRRLLHEEANSVVISDAACRPHASFSSRVERTIGERPGKLQCLAETPSAGEYTPLVPTIADGSAPRSAFKSGTKRFREPEFTATPGPAAYLDRHMMMEAALTKCGANNGASTFVCGVPPYAASRRASNSLAVRMLAHAIGAVRHQKSHPSECDLLPPTAGPI